ncbi:Crp/Fnr family transcriptional regulator [Senegalimassilia anaerobia]
MEAINLFVQPKPQLSRAIERATGSGGLPCKRATLDPGDFLFREGDNARTTFYIQRGLVRLYSGTPDGHTKTVFFHKAGTLIGFQEFQQTENRKPTILNACATTKVELLEISGEAFGEFLRADGNVCYAMAQYLFEMMAMQTREAVNASIYPVLQRFAALLLTLTSEFGTAHAPAIVPFSNEEIAGMLGVHVNSVTNSVASLRKAECVERQHGALVITDFKKLKNVAEYLIVSKK